MTKRVSPWAKLESSGASRAPAAAPVLVSSHPKEAARWHALLHVMSAYPETPANRAHVPVGPVQESAEAIISDALRRAEELEPAVVKGETLFGAPGPAFTRLSKGAAALVVDTHGHRQHH